MAYTSFPLYLDPSPNWNQQQQQQQQQGFAGNPSFAAGDIGNLPQQHATPRADGGASAASAVRSNSMTERARLAKIPQPEHALKCPRCDSTNTKFCYFNNYSLTQPRHFCKTCRRYWTRGGSLRNVPVGGGCRHNKRSKSSRSKTSIMDAKGGNSGSDNGATSTAPAAPSQVPFLQSLHSLVGYGSTNIGMNYCGIPSIDSIDYPAASSSGIMLEPWRLQQIHQLPFFPGIEPNSMYQINGESTGATMHFTGHSQAKTLPNMLATQVPSIKMELSSQTQGFNLERHHMGTPSSDQYWRGDAMAGSVMEGGSAGWTDLSGFSSTSTGVLL